MREGKKIIVFETKMREDQRIKDMMRQEQIIVVHRPLLDLPGNQKIVQLHRQDLHKDYMHTCTTGACTDNPKF